MPESRNPYAVLSILLVLLLMTGALAAQQKTDPEAFSKVPFDEWAAKGPTEKIPWKVEMLDAGLSVYQRRMAHFEITVKGKELSAGGNKGDLIALLQLTDGGGKVYRDNARQELTGIDPGKHSSDIDIYWDAFVLPGDYQVLMAVYHSGSSEYSLTRRTLHVAKQKDDPLPEAWRDLPAVEFLATSTGPDPDTFFHPEITGKLYLPVANRTPLRVELLVDFTASELFHGSHVYYTRYLHAVVPTLKAFSELQLQNGTIDAATVDLVRHKVGFTQQNVRKLNWPELRKTVAGSNAITVDVSTLTKKPASPIFLRDEINRRISPGPEQVFIVIGSPLSHYSFSNLSGDNLPEHCRCRIIYLEYDASRRHSADSSTGNVEKMFRPVKVEMFRVHSPDEVRRALARIVKELSQI